ncbi:GL15191 [Drosophila persimilis]|uniref:GL15191 n=1 Tax=Drosophila persimilis TaxID=7234 RepID=B4H3L0_DROPE|nr:GL15191 [Drosophila persimilis]
MAAISSLEKKVDASFSVLEKKVDDSISGLEKKVGVLSETLAEVVALLKLQIKKEPDVDNFVKFPIQSTMELEHLNSIITPELTDFYINKIRSLLGTSSSMPSSLKHVLDEKLILDYNVDGTSGKSSLKNVKEFYYVLESAVKMKIPDEPADKIIRKAIHNIKNCHFQKTSREKKFKLDNNE